MLRNAADVITEETKVPMKWVFVLLSCSGAAIMTAVSVGMYVSTVEGKAMAAQVAANKSEEYLKTIDQRLSRIEGRLNIQGKE